MNSGASRSKNNKPMQNNKPTDSTPDVAQSTFPRPLRDIIRDVGNETVESDGQTLTRFELMMRRHGRKLSTNQS